MKSHEIFEIPIPIGNNVVFKVYACRGSKLQIFNEGFKSVRSSAKFTVVHGVSRLVSTG